jgi:hypothetical protein
VIAAGARKDLRIREAMVEGGVNARDVFANQPDPRRRVRADWLPARWITPRGKL